jgi:hypothetical protein
MVFLSRNGFTFRENSSSASNLFKDYVLQNITILGPVRYMGFCL